VKRLSYIEDAGCLKVNSTYFEYVPCLWIQIFMVIPIFVIEPINPYCKKPDLDKHGVVVKLKSFA